MDAAINIDGVVVTPLKQIMNPGGSIYHALKKSESSFQGFGEAYFSHVHADQIKAWKIHSRMWLNLIVPSGAVKFVLVDQREDSKTFGNIFETIMGPESNYKRLTIPPGITFGFKGVDKETSLVLNVASIEHEPDEVNNFNIDIIDYQW